MSLRIKESMRVIAVTGGSGGHIFPAVGFLEGLKTKLPDLEACLVVPRKSVFGGGEQIAGFVGRPQMSWCKIHVISLSSGTRNSIAKKISLLFDLAYGVLESLMIILKFKPDVVVGFGSLSSIPLVFLGWLSRSTTLIHEQNVIPGKANKFLSYFVDRIAISFPESEKFFKRKERKVILTGNPLRESISRRDRQDAQKKLGLKVDKFTLLVMGGSQGSHRLNFAFLEALSNFPDRERLQVIHLSGAGDFTELAQAYAHKKISQVRLFRLLEEISLAYSASDLVISRAGATSIAEIMFFNLPAVIIPYPYAGAHQELNARILKERGAALIIEDGSLKQGKLAQTLEMLLNSPGRVQQMRSNYKGLTLPDANRLLAEEIINSQSYD